MQPNPLLKRIMKDKKGDIVHSSGYAKVQSGERIGSTSVEGFMKRQRIDANRNYVQSYRDSKVGQTGRLDKAKKMEAPEKPGKISEKNPPVRINPGI